MRRVALLLAGLAGAARAQPAPAPTAAPPAAPDAAPDPSALARASNARALALAQAAEAAGDAVGMRAAVDEFKRAIALDDDPVFECNLAYALEWLKERARAHARYSRCAPRLASLQPQQAARRLAAIGGLEEILVATHVPVRIDATGGASTATITAFPSDEPMNLPATVWLAPGHHTLTVTWSRPDHPSLKVGIDVGADELGKQQAYHLDAPPEPPPVRVRPPEGELDRDDPPPRLVRPAPRSRRAGTVALAAGGVAVVGGAVVHVLSRDPRAHLATLSGQAYDDYLPTWRRYQIGTIALYGAGAAALGVGAYLYLRGGGSPVAITPTPGADGAVVSWTLER